MFQFATFALRLESHPGAGSIACVARATLDLLRSAQGLYFLSNYLHITTSIHAKRVGLGVRRRASTGAESRTRYSKNPSTRSHVKNC